MKTVPMKSTGAKDPMYEKHWIAQPAQPAQTIPNLSISLYKKSTQDFIKRTLAAAVILNWQNCPWLTIKSLGLACFPVVELSCHSHKTGLAKDQEWNLCLISERQQKWCPNSVAQLNKIKLMERKFHLVHLQNVFG